MAAKKKGEFTEGQAPAVKAKKEAKMKKAAADEKHEAENGAGTDSKSVVNTSKYKYEKVTVEGADGKKKHTADNADRLASALRGTSLEELQKIAAQYEIDPAKYSNRNPGLQRMAIGNALRGVIRKGTTVSIGKVKIASLGDKTAA